jgi:hypothetical protein
MLWFAPKFPLFGVSSRRPRHDYAKGDNMRVAVIDIGKPGENLGWAIDYPDSGGTNLDDCIERFSAAVPRLCCI